MIKKKTRSLKGALIEVSLVVPLFVLLIDEFSARAGVLDTLSWIVTNPAAFLINFAIVSGLSTLLFALSKRPALTSFILCTAGIIMAIINYNLIAVREHPLLATTMITLMDVGIFFIHRVWWRWVISLGVVGTAVVVWLFLHFTNPHKPSVSKRARRNITAVALCVLIISLSLTGFMKTDYNNLHIRIKENGYGVTILQYLVSPYIDAPENEPEKPPVVTHSGSNKPDIIVVKLESFTDGKDYEKLRADITPRTEELKSSSLNGRILVSAYGGNTCSTVFDVLSGYCAAFTVPSTSCYGDMLLGKKYQKSYTSTLAEQGYGSVYISAFEKEFTNEGKSAEAMGFEKIIGVEGFPPYKVTIPNSDLMDRVKAEYEQRDKSRPFMMVAETMENHYDFSPDSYMVQDFLIDDVDMLTDSENTTVKGYINGLRHDDQFIGDMLDYFSQCENEVNIIFFSDHRPYLGNFWSVYKKLGFLSEDVMPDNVTADDVDFIYGVPYFIWNNKGLIEAKTTENPISPSYLMPMLFKERGIQGNDVSDFVLTASETVDNFGTSSYKLRPVDEKIENYYRYICKRDILDN
ncbi:MAG: LTA synthase family protein [Oscillospiraceae bacterium]|jgi:phosphoglycerol transferase MdoB-like AlkP superfamily enzyme|nr:LTA synthase family protein [Oscillospiraceae bacterium]